MKPFEITSDVYWCGALHPDLRVFDIIMQTKNGSTYNSYFINDEKKVVIDAVKLKFSDQYLENLKTLVDPETLDYIVVQHNEPDHSGSLVQLMDVAPNARIVCSRGAVKYVQNTVNRDVDIIPVRNGETLELGSRTLQFVVAPNVHWPDTMMTYSAEDKILFTCDFLGAHFCDSRMLNTKITRDMWPDFKDYFDKIMRPFKKNVRSALEKIKELEFETVAPSHGPLLQGDLGKYISAYREWSAASPENDPPKMLIYYASAHGNTGTMAELIAQGAKKQADVQVYNAEGLDPETHLDLIETADAVVLGSPTLNNDAVKPVWDVINSLVTIDVKGKLGASFGSYGWSGEAVKMLDARLADLKFKVPHEGLKAVLIPGPEERRACIEFGEKLANELSK
ncbi:MAG: FprA family A-type flavoprotein [candidate division KSB1 bacterium]|nr:FprA family A-type flavoprotein [candidate division KSB1 bacterium]